MQGVGQARLVMHPLGQRHRLVVKGQGSSVVTGLLFQLAIASQHTHAQRREAQLGHQCTQGPQFALGGLGIALVEVLTQQGAGAHLQVDVGVVRQSDQGFVGQTSRLVGLRRQRFEGALNLPLDGGSSRFCHRFCTTRRGRRPLRQCSGHTQGGQDEQENSFGHRLRVPPSAARHSRHTAAPGRCLRQRRITRVDCRLSNPPPPSHPRAARR